MRIAFITLAPLADGTQHVVSHQGDNLDIHIEAGVLTVYDYKQLRKTSGCVFASSPGAWLSVTIATTDEPKVE